MSSTDPMTDLQRIVDNKVGPVGLPEGWEWREDADACAAHARNPGGDQPNDEPPTDVYVDHDGLNILQEHQEIAVSAAVVAAVLARAGVDPEQPASASEARRPDDALNAKTANEAQAPREKWQVYRDAYVAYQDWAMAHAPDQVTDKDRRDVIDPKLAAPRAGEAPLSAMERTELRNMIWQHDHWGTPDRNLRVGPGSHVKAAALMKLARAAVDRATSADRRGVWLSPEQGQALVTWAQASMTGWGPGFTGAFEVARCVSERDLVANAGETADAVKHHRRGPG